MEFHSLWILEFNVNFDILLMFEAWFWLSVDRWCDIDVYVDICLEACCVHWWYMWWVCVTQMYMTWALRYGICTPIYVISLCDFVSYLSSCSLLCVPICVTSYHNLWAILQVSSTWEVDLSRFATTSALRKTCLTWCLATQLHNVHSGNLLILASSFTVDAFELRFGAF